MSEKLSIVIKSEDDKQVIELTGVMDEDMDLSKIEAIPSDSQIIFDFSGVQSINSCGIRDWIALISHKKGELIYRHCPKVIIEQMNMVKGFLPEGAKIESFYAPFFCESCDHEEGVLLKPDSVVGRVAPQNIKCSNCGKEGMEFDALPAQYFHFLPEGGK